LEKEGYTPNLSTKKSTLDEEITILLNFIAYADGTNDLVDISNIIDTPVNKLYHIIKKLKSDDLLY
jgi:aminopeptidase-like protein